MIILREIITIWNFTEIAVTLLHEHKRAVQLNNYILKKTFGWTLHRVFTDWSLSMPWFTIINCHYLERRKRFFSDLILKLLDLSREFLRLLNVMPFCLSFRVQDLKKMQMFLFQLFLLLLHLAVTANGKKYISKKEIDNKPNTDRCQTYSFW